MDEAVKQRTEEFKKRHGRKRLWYRVVSVLSAVVVFTTTYSLILPAITMENAPACGVEEHTHTDECYEERSYLSCGMEETPGHTHDESCYDESGNLICGMEERSGHTHDESCYSRERVLNCEKQEHIHTRLCYPEPDESEQPPETTEPSETAEPAETTEPSAEPGENEKDPEEEEKEQGDPTADLENPYYWEATFAHIKLSGIWAKDVLAIAETQFGYTESTRNYIYNNADARKGYTRYGAWYGSPYGDWCAMFCSFCLHYANIPVEDFPQDCGTRPWVNNLTERKMFASASDYSPKPGDLIFFDYERDGLSDHVGLVYKVDKETGMLTTIEGNHTSSVQTFEYTLNDGVILGYGVLPENPNAPTDTEEVSKPEETAEPETEQAETRKDIELSAQAENGVTVTLTAPADALDVPADELVLSIAVVRDDAAKSLIEAEAGNETRGEENVRRKTVLFDIKILHGEKEIQPLKAVSVTFSGIEAPKNDEQVFHVDAEKETVEKMETSTSENGDISVETDHFSVYGVTFTVDFHYGDYDYSILGKDEILLSALLSALNIDRDIADVTGVSFSDPALVSVEKTEGDWKLTSLKAFNTEETLTLTFADGEELVIDVTDAPASGVGENYVANTGEVTAVSCSMITGTAPWDADDAPGNDSGASNAVVRSFDTVFYNVGYTLNLTDKYQGVFSGYKKGNLYVEMTLPLSKEKATFDLSGVPWLLNATVTDNGASQTLTGYYAMDAADNDYAIPATGTLKLAVAVKGMSNGSTVQPTIRLWLDEPKAKSITPNAVTVSAVANYNVSIIPIIIAKNVKLDTVTGEVFGSSGNYGQLATVGVYLSSANIDVSKGIRGLHVDSRSVSFMIQSKFVNNGTPISTYTSTDASAPILWDYSLVGGVSPNTGILGRNMTSMFTGTTPALVLGQVQLPYPKRNSYPTSRSVFDSGDMSAELIPGQGIKVTFQNIDWDYIFPTLSATGGINISNSNALLATGVVQVFYPTGTVSNAGTFVSYCDINDTITINGTQITDYDTSKCDENGSGPSDNRARLSYQQTAPGTWAHALRINGAQSSVAYERDTRYLFEAIHSSKNTDTLYCADFFIKFTDGLEPVDDGKQHFLLDASVDGAVDSFTKKILYVAKGDGSTWSSREEMLTTHMHRTGNLLFYSSLSDLQAAGKICVGVWYEIRNPQNIPLSQNVRGSIDFRAFHFFKVREDATISYTETQEMTLESRVYSENTSSSRETSASLSRAWNYAMSSFGRPPALIEADMMTRNARTYEHVKSTFNEAYSVSGNGYATTWIYNSDSGTLHPNSATAIEPYGGNTIAVIGERAEITKFVAQEQSGVHRSSYFIDNGERSVDYALSSRVMANASSVPTSGTAMTTVTITDTLPLGISYVPGSAVLGGTYNQPPDRKSHGTVTGGTPLTDNGMVTGAPVCATTTGNVTLAVTPNGDGSTQLKWIFTNVQVGQDMPKIYYSARIGNADDPLHDVRDGESFTNTVNIFSTNSRKTFSGAYGNLATATINVFRMENATVQKNIITPEVDVNKPVTYTITYINNSSVPVAAMNIIDLLPYNGDLRGSSFHGSYTIGEVKVERLNEAAGQYALDYTTDTSVQGHEGDVFASGFAPSYTAATATVSGNTTTMTFPANTTPTLLNFKGTNVGAYAKIKITVTLNLSGNKDGDKYYNDAAYNTPSIPAPVYTVPVNSQVVQATANLTISKTVIGGGEGSFPFKVTLKDAEDNPVIIPADTASPATYTVDPVTGEITFSLKHGESVTLKAVPVGTVATIAETGHDGYTVLIKNTTAGGTVLSNGDTAFVTVTKDQAVEVVNNAGVTLPSTGGPGTLIYLLCGLALCAAAAVGYRSLRRERERRQT